ncbi:MAG: helix-turn-helix domain-containing protein [Lewinella sp.]
MKCYLPQAALQPYVQCYVSLKLPELLPVPMVETTPPLPTKAIMFWFYEDPTHVINSQGLDQQAPRAFIVPQCYYPNTCTHSGRQEFFTITFWPGKMRHLFRFPWLEVANYYIDINDTGDQAFIDFARRIEDTNSLAERVRLSDDFLLSRLPRHDTPLDRMQLALDNLSSNQPASVRDLARSLHLSERQFRRRFKETFGISPVNSRRVMRFQKAFDWMKNHTGATLMDATEAFSYTDPSHLYKDYLHFTGESPRQFLERELHNFKWINWRENYWQ